MKRLALAASFLSAVNMIAATPTSTRTFVPTRTPTHPPYTSTPIPSPTPTPTPDMWGFWYDIPPGAQYAVGAPDLTAPYHGTSPGIPPYVTPFYWPCNPKLGGNPNAADFASSGCMASIQPRITPSWHGGIFRMGYAVHYGNNRFPETGGWSKVNAPTAVVYDPTYPPTSTPVATNTRTRTPTRTPTKTITAGGPPTRTPTLLPCSEVPPGAPIPCRTSTPTPGGPTMTPTKTPTHLSTVTPTPPACGDSLTLCVGTGVGQYKIKADWAVPAQGKSGHGAAVQMTRDTGYFWFFDPNNVEMVIKVLDGCPVNGYYWAFAGGLTNVQVDITVTAVVGGSSKVYHNPSGTAFQPIQDTSAFACGATPMATAKLAHAAMAAPKKEVPVPTTQLPLGAQIGVLAALLGFSAYWVISRSRKKS